MKFANTFLIILSLLFCLTASAQDSEKPVKMKDLPKAVRETVQAQSKGATIRGLSKEVEGGKTLYEAELKINGHNKDVIIDPTGAVVTIEEEVPVDSLPSSVKAEFEKHAAGGKIQMVESISENGAIIAYEAHIKTGKKRLEVEVGADGKLIKTENDGEAEDKEPAAGKKGSKKP